MSQWKLTLYKAHLDFVRGGSTYKPAYVYAVTDSQAVRKIVNIPVYVEIIMLVECEGTLSLTIYESCWIFLLLA